ncbi:hypothetical protein [Erwinia sorbitola]|uniref:hypothetical protein n=1 Tax=Erwinia sorbitola TaxID=2681984 RepID=UPI001E51386C|nr:hypothetical protein [Erwinia sorbitola]
MESEHIEPSSIPLLDLSAISRDMLALGKRLADTKYQIDMLGKNGWGELTANLHGLEASGEWNGPDDALTFFSKVFPFAILPSETEPMGIYRVPTERVIGRSWRWWPDHLNGNSEEKLREHLEGPHAAESTSYYFISALAVLLAVQGQSRVNYCRQRHIPYITARVTYLSYPPADRFKLYHVTRGNTRQSWVVLNDRYLQAIQWPRITLPALSRYGVHSAVWPQTFPSPERIFDELHHPQPAEDFVAPCVDLLALQEKMEVEKQAALLESKPVKMALSDMDIANIWPVTMTLMFFFLLSLVAAGVTAGGGWLGLVSLVICGMSGSLLLLLAAPVFLVRQSLRSRRKQEVEEADSEERKEEALPPSAS